MRLLAKFFFVLALMGALPALAEPSSQEPPARVGRVSLVSGTLAFYGPGDSEWSAAKVNLPVAAGGWFATDPQSRAQIRIGPDSISLANDTQINFADLRDKVMQIALTQGRVALHVRRLQQKEDEDAEVDIARGGVWLLQPGEYDIDSGTADQPTRITVFEGSAKFVGSGIEMVVKAGDRLVLSGADKLAANVERAEPDEFVRWCRDHDYSAERVAKARHVSPGMTGFEELDQYGAWSTAADYGAVWYPKAVPADWAPYRQGHWVWLDPWGWNWVDDEPWGFAPFHYGRWASIDGRWGWVPGEFVSEPVYAPALVAFIPPDAIDVGLPGEAGPSVGWFPLAPGELYWPAYAANPTYIREVNIANVNIVNINRVTTTLVTGGAAGAPPAAIRDQRFANRGAATVVPARVLAASAPVAPAAIRVSAPMLRRGAVAVAPPAVFARPPAAATAAARPGTAAGPAALRRGMAGRNVATPAHPPERPHFTQLAPAPRVAQTAAPAPAAATPGARTIPPAAGEPGRPPAAAPAFSRLPPAGAPGPRQTTQQPQPAAPGPAPAAQAVAPPAPGHPPGRPDFAHLPPWRPGSRPPPQSAQRTAPSPNATQPPARSQAAMPPPAAPAPAAQQRAMSSQAPQRAAADAAARARATEAQQAQQRAAAQAAAQQRAAQAAAQQRAGQAATQQRASQAAAQQRVAQAAAQQQRAAQGAAQAAAQQRAAQAAAQQQRAAQAAAQQRAAQAAAQQQRAAQGAAQAAAQQRAAQAAAQQRAAQGAAQAAAQQRAAQAAAQQRAAQAAAQQRAAQGAAQAAAQQRAAQAAAQAAAARQHAAQACGHPGGPPCPK